MKLMRWVAAGSSLGLLALLSGCGSTPPATPPATPVSSTLAHPAASTPNASSEEVVRGPLGRQLDEALSRYESYGLSGSFLVEHAGELVLHKGYGLCDPARALPCRPDTLFDVGSISKQFTATAILRLEDVGKLSVNDELGRHIPELGPELAQLTLHQLLTHSSGLDEDISRYAAGDREAFLRAVGGHPHAGSPGGSPRRCSARPAATTRRSCGSWSDERVFARRASCRRTCHHRSKPPSRSAEAPAS
jgi:CubicO group peptidase (beta-lactamase class C family)